MLTSQRKLWKFRATVVKSKLKTEMLKQMLLKNKMTENMMEIPSSGSDSSSEESEEGGD